MRYESARLSPTLDSTELAIIENQLNFAKSKNELLQRWENRDARKALLNGCKQERKKERDLERILENRVRNAVSKVSNKLLGSNKRLR